MARLIAALTLGTLGAFAQSPAAPAFEVASVKPSGPTSPPSGISRSTGRFNVSNASLKFLITWAYDLTDDRLAGAPSWLDSAKFDIVAKVPDGKLAPGQLQSMMQALLADRFKLQVHPENRDLSMYALVADKDGPKVHFVDLGDGIGQNPFNMTDRGRLVGTKVTAEMLAKVLSGQLGRFVQDMSGVKGVFDFTLEWTPDADTPNGNRPSLFTAIREQLGFRLEARKAPVEVIVIDRVLREPLEN